MFDGLRAASEVGVSTIICSTASRGSPVRSWTRSIRAWPCSRPAPSSPVPPPAVGSGVRGDGEDLEGAAAVRGAVGSTTVGRDQQQPGVAGVGLAALERLELGAQSLGGAEAAGGRQHRAVRGREADVRLARRAPRTATARAATCREPGPGRESARRSASRHRRQVRRRDDRAAGRPMRRPSAARPRTPGRLRCRSVSPVTTRPPEERGRPGAHQGCRQAPRAADRRGPAEPDPARRDRRRQRTGARSPRVLDGREPQPDQQDRGPPGARTARAPRPTPSAPAGRRTAWSPRRRAARRRTSRACAAPRPPSHSRIIARSSSASARENRATSSTVESRSRCTVTASSPGSGSTTAGSVNTYLSPYVDSRPSSSSRMQRVRLDEHVRARARVVQEPRQGQLLGDRVAADDVLRLEHADLEAGLGEVGRADQPVVAGADDDDVDLLRWLGRQRRVERVRRVVEPRCPHRSRHSTAPPRSSPVGKACSDRAPSAVIS